MIEWLLYTLTLSENIVKYIGNNIYDNFVRANANTNLDAITYKLLSEENNNNVYAQIVELNAYSTDYSNCLDIKRWLKSIYANSQLDLSGEYDGQLIKNWEVINSGGPVYNASEKEYVYTMQLNVIYQEVLNASNI